MSYKHGDAPWLRRTRSGSAHITKFLAAASLTFQAPPAAALPAMSVTARAVAPQATARRYTPRIDAATAGCEALRNAFADQQQTKVTLVRYFRKGDDLNLDGDWRQKAASNDVCVVKLTVGPGFPGDPLSPHTSRGIAVEVWLPAPDNWKGRLHVLGGGGYNGMPSVSSMFELTSMMAGIATDEGSVAALTDSGHVGGPESGLFGFTAEGKLNSVLWRDFAERSLHEMTISVKRLASAYYGKPVQYAYFDGCSTGGRQALKNAQKYPEDYDGILAGAPAINWTRFITYELYPQIVMLQDFQKPIPYEKIAMVTARATSACDMFLNGEHDGFVSDPGMCRYDPLKDRGALCKADGGDNDSASCVSRREATAINKMWYGHTAAGTAPDPARSTGYGAKLDAGQLWFGVPRGSPLPLAMSRDGKPSAFPIATAQVAMNLEDPALGGPEIAGGRDGWQELSYADLAHAAKRGVELQSVFSNINTDNPDLTQFERHGAKLIHYHGLADSLIPAQGSAHYFANVVSKMGGAERVGSFYRYFEIPGVGHCSGVGAAPGIQGVSPKPNPPMPAPGQLFAALMAWREQGVAPDRLVISSPDKQLSRPLCEFAEKMVYLGGDRRSAKSYACESRK